MIQIFKNSKMTLKKVATFLYRAVIGILLMSLTVLAAVGLAILLSWGPHWLAISLAITGFICLFIGTVGCPIKFPWMKKRKEENPQSFKNG